jgi:hypothetical protein
MKIFHETSLQDPIFSILFVYLQLWLLFTLFFIKKFFYRFGPNVPTTPKHVAYFIIKRREKNYQGCMKERTPWPEFASELYRACRAI